MERFLLFFQGPPSPYSVSSSRRILLLIQKSLELEEMKVPVFIFFARRSLSLQAKSIPGFSSASAVQHAATTGALACHLWWPDKQRQFQGGDQLPPEVEAPVPFQPKTGWETGLAGPLPIFTLVHFYHSGPNRPNRNRTMPEVRSEVRTVRHRDPL